MISENLYKLLQFRGRTAEMSYKKNFEKRIEEAKTQLKTANEKLEGKEKEYYVDLALNKAKEFFSVFGCEIFETEDLLDEKLNLLQISEVVKEQGELDYEKIQEKYKLNNISHIVWMKFAKEKGKSSGKRYLGVVAASNDVNFSMENNSGKIIHELGLEWDETFVLLFPLQGITDGMRKDIECGLGNYLIKERIPILDFYSHRFQ